MNRLNIFLLIIVFSLYGGNIYSQYINPVVDKAPLLKNCDTKSDVAEKVKCSESTLLAMMYENIDTIACPANDTARIYHIDFLVDSKGQTSSPVVSNYDGNESCTSFLQNSLESRIDELDFYPAERGSDPVDFKKSFRIVYPSQDSIAMIETDSSGAMKVAEEMPRFAGCEGMIGSSNDKQGCAQHKMLMFIYSSLKYPSVARENGVEGMVVVQFVVNKQGYIEDAEIVRDIGANCGKAVMDVIENMNMLDPPFVPGKQRGEVVKVQYTLPVKFSLGKKKKKKKRKK